MWGRGRAASFGGSVRAASGPDRRTPSHEKLGVTCRPREVGLHRRAGPSPERLKKKRETLPGPSLPAANFVSRVASLVTQTGVVLPGVTTLRRQMTPGSA
ncbi:hypothetical protein Dgeo_2965 (plasmid) [Deinococcus geothermalis DSM 11300]|uniref:Uncharacterized protein n=1 Tax=Deinococcus geothermalis (strain DSM 11300 / CIP 105573 / AG-3a) TaxID=319795 RepID=A8ZR99_DEIGD|nr:hypothetical protein Dgeo_2965 [Deinococcus geothermalis DSM 11300]